MGVSLERVQFKFASIIGELCSEPDILSQFAVWLDLRLAEFKLKGAISLDCSGEEPDPVWLKGLNKHKEATLNSRTDRQTSNNSPAFRRPSSQHRSAQQTPHSNSPLSHSETVPNMDMEHRLSPEVVVVKEEPGVYPVSLHVPIRKRPANDDANPSEFHDQSLSPSFSISPSKQRKISTTDSPSNQSLMSVIGGYHITTEGSDTRGDNSVVDTGNTDSNTIELSDELNDISMSSVQPFADFFNSAPQASHSTVSVYNNSASGNSTGTSADQVPVRNVTSPFLTSTCANASQGQSRPRFKSAETLFRRSRIPNVEILPTSTVNNIVANVGLFERWLWCKPFGETRPMYEIPPAKLDEYLAEFFTTLKLPSGEEYKLESLRPLRSYLERYLKGNDYPASIITSGVFVNSRKAFKRKKESLSHKQHSSSSL